METWKAIAGYEGLYQVSDLGNVRSLVKRNNRWKPGILRPGKTRRGYLFVTLCKDGVRKHMKVHRLVAEAFVPNTLNLETVNHKDQNKLNNAASNLEWMSRADNIVYSRARQVQQFDMQGNLLETFPSVQEASRQTGISDSHICQCCLGQRRSAGGFVWRYLPL